MTAKHEECVSQLDGDKYGAIIRPSDQYCHPRTVDDDSVLDWEIHPVDELRDAGITPCPVCHEGVEQ